MWISACALYLAAMATIPVAEALQTNRGYQRQRLSHSPPSPLLHMMLGKRHGDHLKASPIYTQWLPLLHQFKKDTSSTSKQSYMGEAAHLVNKGPTTTSSSSTQEDPPSPPVGEVFRRPVRMMFYPLLHMLPGRKRYPGLHRHYYPILHAVPANSGDGSKRQMMDFNPDWTQRRQGYPANHLRAWARGRANGLRLKRSTTDSEAQYGQLNENSRLNYKDEDALEQYPSMGQEAAEEELVFSAVNAGGTGGEDSMTDPLFFEMDGSSGNDTSGAEQTTFDRNRRHFAPLLHSIGRMVKGSR